MTPTCHLRGFAMLRDAHEGTRPIGSAVFDCALKEVRESGEIGIQMRTKCATPTGDQVPSSARAEKLDRGACGAA